MTQQLLCPGYLGGCRAPAALLGLLSLELACRATGSTLYVLDEPTTGLHFDHVKKLLADRGNTVVVIEHYLDVIKTADWVIDLGPEGGEAGGRIRAKGTPEQVATEPASFTGHYLAPLLGVPRAKAS
jgi:excinuclease ABC subunit A